MNRRNVNVTRALVVLSLIMKLYLPVMAGSEVHPSIDLPPSMSLLHSYESTADVASAATAAVQFISKDRIVFDVMAEKKLGEVVIARHGKVDNQTIMLSFATSPRNVLSIKTESNAISSISTTLAFNDMIVKLKASDVENRKISQFQHSTLQSIFTKISEDRDLLRLTKAALPLLNVSSLKKLAPLNAEYYHVSDCAVEATDCLVALVAYGTSMGALVSSCGFSFGAGCVAALLAHPILGGAVAIYCGRAIESCGLNK